MFCDGRWRALRVTVPCGIILFTHTQWGAARQTHALTPQQATHHANCCGKHGADDGGAHSGSSPSICWVDASSKPASFNLHRPSGSIMRALCHESAACLEECIMLHVQF